MISLFVLAACNPSEAHFYKKGFRLSCENWETCDADDFSTHYDSVDDCFDTEWARTGTYIEEYENQGCTYDGQQAGECLAALKEIDCETWLDEDSAPSACFFVWECPQE